MSSKFKIELGVMARDMITGFQGTVTGRVECISGCNQYLLAPKVSDDGEHRTGCYFDEQRLEVVLDKPTVKLDNSKARGPDTPAPKK